MKKENPEEEKIEVTKLTEKERVARDAQVIHYTDLYIAQMKAAIKQSRNHDLSDPEVQMLTMWFMSWFESAFTFIQQWKQKAKRVR